MWSKVSCLEEITRRQLELGSNHWPLDLTFDALNTTPTHPDLCFRRIGKSNDRLEFSCSKNVVDPVLIEPPRRLYKSPTNQAVQPTGLLFSICVVTVEL